MRYVRVLLLFLLFLSLCGLTPYEANIYDSNILICTVKKEETFVYNWIMGKIKNKRKNLSSDNVILDVITKKTYSLNECRLAGCSPYPGRLSSCKLQ